VEKRNYYHSYGTHAFPILFNTKTSQIPLSNVWIQVCQSEMFSFNRRGHVASNDGRIMTDSDRV
jgi:hypothetical protein